MRHQKEDPLSVVRSAHCREQSGRLFLLGELILKILALAALILIIYSKSIRMKREREILKTLI